MNTYEVATSRYSEAATECRQKLGSRRWITTAFGCQQGDGEFVLRPLLQAVWRRRYAERLAEAKEHLICLAANGRIEHGQLVIVIGIT
jgi:hypothetical protein